MTGNTDWVCMFACVREQTMLNAAGSRLKQDLSNLVFCTHTHILLQTEEHELKCRNGVGYFSNAVVKKVKMRRKISISLHTNSSKH